MSSSGASAHQPVSPSPDAHAPPVVDFYVDPLIGLEFTPAWTSTLYALPSEMVDSPQDGGGLYGVDDGGPRGDPGPSSLASDDARYGTVGYDDGMSNMVDFAWIDQHHQQQQNDQQPARQSHAQSSMYNQHVPTLPSQPETSSHPPGFGPPSSQPHPSAYPPPGRSTHSDISSVGFESALGRVLSPGDELSPDGHHPPGIDLRDLGRDEGGTPYALVVGSGHQQPLGGPGRNRDDVFSGPSSPRLQPPSHMPGPTPPHSASYLQTNHHIPPFPPAHLRRQSDDSHDRQMAPIPRPPFPALQPLSVQHPFPQQSYHQHDYNRPDYHHPHPSFAARGAGSGLPIRPHQPPSSQPGPPSKLYSPVASNFLHRNPPSATSQTTSQVSSNGKPSSSTGTTSSTSQAPVQATSPTSTASSSARSAPETSHPSEPPSKRPAAKRTPIACSRCRAHKLKCAGGNPCPGCAKRGVASECSYVSEIKRRGKGKGRATMEAEKDNKGGKGKSGADTKGGPGVKERDFEGTGVKREVEEDDDEVKASEEMEVEEQRGGGKTAEKRWPSGTAGGPGRGPPGSL